MGARALILRIRVFLYIYQVAHISIEGAAMTRLCVLGFNNKTLRAEDGDSLSSFEPGSELVAPRLGPALEQANK